MALDRLYSQFVLDDSIGQTQILKNLDLVKSVIKQCDGPALKKMTLKQSLDMFGRLQRMYRSAGSSIRRRARHISANEIDFRYQEKMFKILADYQPKQTLKVKS